MPLALAAAAAAALGGTPLLLGTDATAGDPAQLAQYEGTNGAHAYHAEETEAGEERQEAVLDRCDSDPAYRARNWESCPASAGPPPASAPTSLRAMATAEPSQVGRWGALAQVPSLAIHSVVLPTGKVLWFSRVPQHQGGSSHLYEPATGQTTEVAVPDVEYPNGEVLPANIWCAGQALLPDGRVLVAGGNLSYPSGDGDPTEGRGFQGASWVFIFDPWTETWSRLTGPDGQPKDLVKGRWYPTLTALSDGRVVIVGGWDESGHQRNVSEVEVFTPRSAPGGTDTLETVGSLPDGHSWVNIYPHMSLLPDTTVAGRGDGDRVLLTGPGTTDAFVLHTEDWSWHALANRPSRSRFWGTAVLEPGGPEGSARVTLLGGSDLEADPGAPEPTATTEYLDLNDPGFAQDPPAPTWRQGPSLTHARSHFNTVLLPDGSKLSNGGGLGQAPDGNLYADPVYESELYDPQTGTWREAVKEDDARTYHSTSVLLPDGRVLSAGDDRLSHLPQPYGTAPPGEGPTAQVFSPPYLFTGTARPQIASAPQAVPYGASFALAADGGAAIDRFVLMRPGAVTHAVDMEQRSLALALRREGGRLTVTSPANPTIAPPGWYMLFAIDANGVPSQARWIRLDPAAAVPAEPPAAEAPAPPPAAGAPAPAAGPAKAADRRAPRLRVRRARATVRGRTVTVRIVVTSNERAILTGRIVRMPRDRGRVSASTGPRRTLRAHRATTVTLRARTTATTPRRVRVRLRAVDARGNRTPVKTLIVRVTGRSPRT